MSFFYDEQEGGKYKNLKKLLEDNGLKILCTIAVTDIWQSYIIVDKEYCTVDNLKTKVYISFFYEAYKGSMFSWDLTNRPCMDENDFIEKIKGILESDNQYVPSLTMKD